MTIDAEKQYHVLIVDDETIVQSFVTDALEDEGHVVRAASSGYEALQMLESGPVDMLITDIRMPGMDGIELAEHVREAHPAVGVIFITGYASLNSAKDAIKHGALDYIMKPFELNEIRQAVRNGIIKLSEAAADSSHEQLSSLSDLSHMLFGTGDRKSLVTSSLKFAMMHQHCKNGAMLYRANENDQFVMLSIRDNETREEILGAEPLQSLIEQEDITALQEPTLVSCLDEHPFYRLRPDPDLRRFLLPAWTTGEIQSIAVPVMRTRTFFGIIMLDCEDDTFKVKQTDLKFLSIMASQLAITLENVSLLEETRKAYARLKELQDETIGLEKMATRGEMSAEIGHELNNFLGVVAGNIALLDLQLKKKNYDHLDKYMNTVSATMEKITTFTSNLMDLRPISSTKDVVYFDKIIAEVAEYLHPQKRFRGVQINMPDHIDSVPFLADTTQIQQLLYNLFHNAADAMEKSETREIAVSVEVLPHLDSFRVSIRDTGIGFDSESLSKAFQDKFTTKPTGHGFGLVVCRRIIDNHDGELEIESSPGAGACISITFPLAAKVAEPAPTV